MNYNTTVFIDFDKYIKESVNKALKSIPKMKRFKDGKDLFYDFNWPNIQSGVK